MTDHTVRYLEDLLCDYVTYHYNISIFILITSQTLYKPKVSNCNYASKSSGV